ncbi:UNKNOWN [Stylonychia lemnae]|uniref:Uncharacterized protein n=1 Tax=Stylonychia lemnae TaxID=5949 RepID=A0A078A9W1_STYLE|nr:UNKNOWN [Stylonychia lemnae]|eukprot:CDW79055.1 UNKNOWN [Stylonychia lemnae]
MLWPLTIFTNRKKNLKQQKDRDGLIANKVKSQQKIPPEYLYPIGACGMIDPPPHCMEAHSLTNYKPQKIGYDSAWQWYKQHTPKVQADPEIDVVRYEVICEYNRGCRFVPKISPPQVLNYLIRQ